MNEITPPVKNALLQALERAVYVVVMCSELTEESIEEHLQLSPDFGMLNIINYDK